MAKLDQQESDLAQIGENVQNIANDIARQGVLIGKLESTIGELQGSEEAQNRVSAAITALKENTARIAAIVPEPQPETPAEQPAEDAGSSTGTEATGTDSE